MAKAIFKLSNLITANETLIATEKANKEILETFNETTCSNNLHTWAASSFQPSFIIYQYKLTGPEQGNKHLCSDGVYRDIWGYFSFIMKYEFTSHFLTKLQEKFEDIELSYSINLEPIILNIHATKKTV